MKTHPYLRAYMAGITFPTLFLLVWFLIWFPFVLHHVVTVPGTHGEEFPVERVFLPFIVGPNFYGLWNILYIAIRSRRSWPIGLHGAVMPFLVFPGVFFLFRSMGFAEMRPGGVFYLGQTVPFGGIVLVLVISMGLYYLIWKYIIHFFNRVLGIGM